MMSAPPHVNGDALMLFQQVAEAMRRYEQLAELPMVNEFGLELLDLRSQELCDALAEAERSGLVH